MTDQFDLVVQGGAVALPSGLTETDVGVRDGRVAAIGSLGQAKTADTLDARGLTILPGVIDTQVHFREPGLTHKEDLATGTLAAVKGGVTAIFEMPNTNPSTVTTEDFQSKLDLAAGRTWCDHAFFIGAAAENADRLGELERLPGCSGVKVFMGASTGSLLVSDDPTLEAVLRNGARRVAVHCEDEPRMIERRKMLEAGEFGEMSPALHPVARDDETALRATTRLLSLARKAGRRVHVLHVTTAEEMVLLAKNKDVATVEVTPQHLTLAAPDCYERLGTYAQMNPPIREERHRDALWRAIADGVVDVVGSDHAPHTREEKDRPYPNSPSGMPGVQTLLPLLLDHMNEGRLTLQRLIDLTSAGPQRIYNIACKGRIALGYDGDMTIVDLKARRTIEESWLASRCGWSPFTGQTVTGWPTATVIRGNVVMREDEVLGTPIGKPTRFVETLPHA